jgi:HPt (histidine-containing phosphotransfer) domain-containing protein
MDDYMPKPIELQVMRAKLHQWLPHVDTSLAETESRTLASAAVAAPGSAGGATDNRASAGNGPHAEANGASAGNGTLAEPNGAVAPADTPPDGVPSPFDPACLAEISDGDAEVEREILLAFRDSVREDSRTLELALADGDANEIRRRAHRIKGSSSTIGAAALAAAALAMERAGENQDLAAVAACQDALRTELANVEAYLAQL